MIEKITLKELKYILHYNTSYQLLVHKFCQKGEIYFLRKNHLSRKHGFNFGRDVLIVSPEDFSDL